MSICHGVKTIHESLDGRGLFQALLLGPFNVLSALDGLLGCHQEDLTHDEAQLHKDAGQPLCGVARLRLPLVVVSNQSRRHVRVRQDAASEAANNIKQTGLQLKGCIDWLVDK